MQWTSLTINKQC